MNFRLLNWDGYFFTFENLDDKRVVIRVMSTKGLNDAVNTMLSMFNHLIVTNDDIHVDIEGWEE